MTPLGKSMVFNLKYMDEFGLLLDDPEKGKEPDLTGLDDAEHIRKMVRTVGAAADEQAADFLELCAKRIEDHFIALGISTLDKKRKRNYVLRQWSWGTRVYVSSAPGSWFSCGCDTSALRFPLDKDVCGAVTLWLWSEGGRKGADAIRKGLGNWPDPFAPVGVELSGYGGTVFLACIPIKAQPPESFDVDRDPLIEEVTKTFSRIGLEQVKAIASLVAGLKKPDEE